MRIKDRRSLSYITLPLPLDEGKGEVLERGADAPLKHPTLLTQIRES